MIQSHLFAKRSYSHTHTHTHKYSDMSLDLPRTYHATGRGILRELDLSTDSLLKKRKRGTSYIMELSSVNADVGGKDDASMFLRRKLREIGFKPIVK